MRSNYENIRNQLIEDRNKILKVMKTLELKDNSDHITAGLVLSRYMDVLTKITQQLIEIEKLNDKEQRPTNNVVDIKQELMKKVGAEIS